MEISQPMPEKIHCVWKKLKTQIQHWTKIVKGQPQTDSTNETELILLFFTQAATTLVEKQFYAGNKAHNTATHVSLTGLMPES